MGACATGCVQDCGCAGALADGRGCTGCRVCEAQTGLHGGGAGALLVLLATLAVVWDCGVSAIVFLLHADFVFHLPTRLCHRSTIPHAP